MFISLLTDVSQSLDVVSPMPRQEYRNISTPVGFCGGSNRGFTHYEAIQNGRTLVGWRVDQASPTGNCSIRISDVPRESSMIHLRPLDGSGNDKGWFPCGRIETNFEGKEVRIPRDIECDACILELVWQTEKGKQSYCSDILVAGGLTQECPGICQNDGICANGICMCTDSFEGTFCQYPVELATRESSGFLNFNESFDLGLSEWPWKMIFIYLILILATVALVLGAVKLFKLA